MKSIKRYTTETAYNADVQSNNIVANQVSKTMDTGKVHYIINDYTYTLTFDGQNPTKFNFVGYERNMYDESQLGSLSELQFNILKNGGVEFYLQDTQSSSTYHIIEVKYSSNALQRFGWTESELEEQYGPTIASCDIQSGNNYVVANMFVFMKDLIELTVVGMGDMFIGRNNGGEIILVKMSVNNFVSEVETAYDNAIQQR